MLLGQPVYASLKWTVSSISTLLNYYIDSCEVDFTTGQISIINKNCYLTALGARQLQQSKVVTKESQFQFTSFFVGGGASTIKMKLNCSVKICPSGTECFKHLSTKDSDCEQIAPFIYKAKTFEI